MINVANMASFYASRISVQASSFLTDITDIADNFHEGKKWKLSLKHSITRIIGLNPYWQDFDMSLLIWFCQL